MDDNKAASKYFPHHHLVWGGMVGDRGVMSYDIRHVHPSSVFIPGTDQETEPNAAG